VGAAVAVAAGAASVGWRLGLGEAEALQPADVAMTSAASVDRHLAERPVNS
jgi:hypothetical protein